MQRFDFSHGSLDGLKKYTKICEQQQFAARLSFFAAAHAVPGGSSRIWDGAKQAGT